MSQTNVESIRLCVNMGEPDTRRLTWLLLSVVCLVPGLGGIGPLLAASFKHQIASSSLLHSCC